MTTMRTLREIALSEPGICVEDFIAFAIQSGICERFEIEAPENKTVLETAHGDDLLIAFKEETTTTPHIAREAIARDLSALEATYSEVRAMVEKNYRTQLDSIQLRCGRIGHVSVCMQVAGEGKYCTVCGYRDYTDA